MATVEQIREAMHRAPFLGFEMRLVDGRSFHVPHPDFVSVPQSPRGREVMFHDRDGRTHRIDLVLIVEIEEPAAPERAGSSPDGAGGVAPSTRLLGRDPDVQPDAGRPDIPIVAVPAVDNSGSLQAIERLLDIRGRTETGTRLVPPCSIGSFYRLRHDTMV